jgi:hypothetical protein
MPRNPEGFSPQFFFAPDKRVSGSARGTTPEKPINPIDTFAGMSDAHKGIITLARRLLDKTIELPPGKAAMQWEQIFNQQATIGGVDTTGQQVFIGTKVRLGSEEVSLWEALKTEARKNHNLPPPPPIPSRGNRTPR